ncbi:HEAT repeat domain-containing protein [Gemmata sp. JC673]|uniref:HEAT repeat domain-containing protein n=1 Tax=Gemmata algarum TaxID=2975278 RepID=A0ABU5F5D4_9BACT|nr:hypothetical protein [Gemmata algarum]MDY3562777.1 HEAT repeat domain-containing protein [Gemmata algarum]
MPTLEKIQNLPDGYFHRLCDDLIRRLHPRYARLRTHGLNAAGESIVGQPDSYVGDSATTCRIAVCYTVQEKSWWTKLLEDVQKAVAASPNVEEIVAALPWDVDRDGPTKGENLDWLEKAKVAAGKARLSTLHGPEIARLLDTDHQDLRHAHLGIPYSRLTHQAILAACRHATAAALADLQAYGRYDPGRYLYRDADRELFRLWQRAARGTSSGADREESVRLIALVNDSGFGKTSLLCSFAASLSACQPVMFLQARHLSFAGEDALVRAVVQALQGVLAPELARGEEVEVVYHLRQDRLTVVLDGLDEDGNAVAVRRAVRYWLDSRLGCRSVLVLSSRREFWRLAYERSWGRWMAGLMADDREAVTPGERTALTGSEPSAGVCLPGLFSPMELERAWVAGGRLPADMYTLPGEVREELRHPFTLRAFLELSAGGGPVVARSRTDIMSAWLDVRLRAEEDAANRITADVYRVALAEVAKRIAAGNAGWVAVDQLGGVPRFDASRPPGKPVERLLHAGILEPLPGHADRIRFVFEAVQDFFLAENDVAAVAGDPQTVALALADGSFSGVYIRLERLGRGLTGSPVRNEFLDALADLDPVRAAVVMQADPGAYEPAVRKKVVAELRERLGSRHRVRAAFTANLLGHLDCQEARNALLEGLPAEKCPFHLRVSGARAFTRLGCVDGVAFVYAYPWFGQGDDPYYFSEDIQRTRAASPAFRSALGDYAAVRLAAASGTSEHVRAVTVLAHLGNARLVEHLKDRLATNGALQGYENHALIAVGTEPAAAVFTSSLRGAATSLSQLGYEDGGMARMHVHYSVSPKSADLRYLITPPFEAALEALIGDADEEVAGLAADLADTNKSPRLLHRSLVVRAGRRGLHSLSTDRVADTVDPPTWVSWWNAAESDAIRSMLLTAMSPVPSAETERILIECLDNPQFRSAAAAQLGQMGSQHAAAPLRRLLEEGLRGWDALEVIRAISLLADPAAVGVLAQMAQDTSGDQLSIITTALGAIGTEASERVLVELLDSGKEADWLVSGLFVHGSPTAVARLVAEARKDGRGPNWLAERLRQAFRWWGWTVGRFHTHVQDRDLIAYLEEQEHEFKGPAKWTLLHAIEPIDSENVRRLLRKVANRRGTPEDDVVRGDDGLRASWLASRDLMNREDAAAVEHFVTEAISLDERRAWAARDLVKLPRDVVATRLREALTAAETDELRAVVVRLMGHFGNEEDAAAVHGFVESGNDGLADAAYEALCRLRDPLLVPADWGGP